MFPADLLQGGHHIHICGAPSSGKTRLALSLVVDCLSAYPDSHCLIIDTHNAWSPSILASLLPHHIRNITLIHPPSTPSFLALLARLPTLIHPNCRLVVIDSVSAPLHPARIASRDHVNANLVSRALDSLFARNSQNMHHIAPLSLVITSQLATSVYDNSSGLPSSFANPSARAFLVPAMSPSIRISSLRHQNNHRILLRRDKTGRILALNLSTRASAHIRPITQGVVIENLPL